MKCSWNSEDFYCSFGVGVLKLQGPVLGVCCTFWGFDFEVNEGLVRTKSGTFHRQLFDNITQKDSCFFLFCVCVPLLGFLSVLFAYY